MMCRMSGWCYSIDAMPFDGRGRSPLSTIQNAYLDFTIHFSFLPFLTRRYALLMRQGLCNSYVFDLISFIGVYRTNRFYGWISNYNEAID